MHSSPLDVGFDVSDTVCNCRVVSQVFSSLCPILAELSFAQDPTWWLIDSGAAVTVVAESNFHHFHFAWFFFERCEYWQESLENRHFECQGREHPTQHLVDNSLVQIWLDVLAVVRWS